MKALIAFCLRRPVFVSAFYFLVLVAAALSWASLPLQLLPDMSLPTLAVWTGYPDAPPERVERGVTEPVEQAVGGVAGLTHVTSQSQLGGSLVRLDFGWGADLELALLEVREQLDRLADRLPEDAERPVVLRLDPSGRPILWVAVSARAEGGESTSEPQGARLARIKQIAQETVARRLEQLEGVARVRVTGGFDPRVSVLLQPDRLLSHGIGLGEIADAVERSNVSLLGGVVRRGPLRYSLEVTGEATDLEQLGQIVVSAPGGPPVRLADLGSLEPDFAQRRGLVRLDRQEVLLLLVEKAADANTVATAKDVRTTLLALGEELPGVHLQVVTDESRFIRRAIDGVTLALLIGGGLAVGVLFFFLRRRGPLVAVAVAVPLSLAVTLVLFDVLDVSINLLALSGLALGVGMLLDNAIVVVENVTRHREEGLGAFEASLEGTREVAVAVTTSTLTTISVFLPLTFVEGLGGRLFRDQSLAVVASLLASLLVALTVVPLLLARGGARGRNGHRTPTPSPPGHRGLWIYEPLLGLALRHRITVTVGALVLVGLGGWLAWSLPRELVPAADQRRLELHLELPPETDLPWLAERSAKLEAALGEWPETLHVLADLGERDQARLDIDPRTMAEGHLTVHLLSRVDGEEARRRLTAAGAWNGTGELEIRGARTDLERLLLPEDADLLIDWVTEERRATADVEERLLGDLAGRRQLVNVRRATPVDLPAYRLHFDRDAARRHGVTLQELGDTLDAATTGKRASELRRVQQDVPIVLRLPSRFGIDELLALPVPAEDDFQPLGRFVDVELVRLPSMLWRRDQVPVVRWLADLAPGVGLQEGVSAVREVLEDTLPSGHRSWVGGTNEAFRDGLRGAAWSLALSLLLIYLLLAAQFENLLQPLVVLAAVPLALSGVSVALLLTGQTVNLLSLTGGVVLTGIVVNDAILKVDRINALRSQGLPLMEAVVDAGRQRFRPILMTSVTTVAGLLPLVLGSGTGQELRAPLAWTILGGLVSSTLLTLLVVPVLYTLITPSRGEGAPP